MSSDGGVRDEEQSVHRAMWHWILLTIQLSFAFPFGYLKRPELDVGSSMCWQAVLEAAPAGRHLCEKELMIM